MSNPTSPQNPTHSNQNPDHSNQNPTHSNQDPAHETPGPARAKQGPVHAKGRRQASGPRHRAKPSTSPVQPGPAVPVPGTVPDRVAGDPPVPITAWYLPRPRSGVTVPAALVRRLIANYTQPGAPVTNLSTGHRRLQPQSPPASLIITDWPHPTPTRSSHQGSGPNEPGNHPDGLTGARDHLAACAGQLAQGGCLAVVVTARDIPELLGVLVQAARTTGLRYLQHIVVVHQTKPRHAEQRPGGAVGQSLRAHTDVLVFLQPTPRPDTQGTPADSSRTKARSRGRRPRT